MRLDRLAPSGSVPTDHGHRPGLFVGRSLPSTAVSTWLNRRATSAFAPSDIAGLKQWFKADAITGLNDGDAVATWNDSSGLGNNASQASAGLRPVYKTAILNGKPIVRFDNTDDYMSQSLTVAQPNTVFVVFQVNETGSWSAFGSGVGGSVYLYGASLSESKMHAGSDMAVGSGITQSTWYIFGCRFNGASSKGNRSDSGTTATGNPNTAGWNTNTQLSSNGRFGVDLAEVIVYDTALSGANVDLVGAYLASKYALTWTGGAT